MTKDPEQNFLETVNREYLNCAACGECRMVCPVYGVSGLEKHVARGRLALAKALADKELELTDAMAASFENCLLCMACVRHCTGHVDMIQVVLESRAFIQSKQGGTKIKKAAFKALTSKRKYQDMGIAAARKAQSLFMSALPEKSGLRLKLSLPGFAHLSQRVLPALAQKPFISNQDQVHKADHSRHQAALFVGCAGNYIYASIPKKAVQLLNALDVDVIVLAGQGCCGAPVQAHADTKVLEKLAENNVRTFSTVAHLPVITLCSSGGLMLKHHYPAILKETHLASQALEIAGRTRDICEYLVEQIGMEKIRSKIKNKISQTLTYHDPCHMSQGQQIIAQPRTLLQAVCENYVEMTEAHKCCGLGGTYGLGHPDISHKILARKMENIQGMNKHPSLLATGCPACIMQLTHGVHTQKLDIKVGHTLEFLWQALL